MYIELFEEWQLNEAKYHFSYNHFRYTIRQSKDNPSKFGIKTKEGDWEIFTQDHTFDAKKHDMEINEFLDWIQTGIKHFNILGVVTRKEIAESEWKSFFRYELKHNKPINKRYAVLKLQCGKRNAILNDENRPKKEKSDDN